MIFAGVQEKEYSKKLSKEVDKQIKEMIEGFCNMDTIKIKYNDLDELLHNAASIGQYEGFKLGLKAMFEFVKEIE